MKELPPKVGRPDAEFWFNVRSV